MIKKILLCLFVIGSCHIYAFKVVEDIALEVDGYQIPIKIYVPENTTKKSPIHFYIHGGGWNGGTETKVPRAAVSADARYLCDKLGIIYVGLAYRCKGNNGTFEKAIFDLESSVKWFLDRANKFNADVEKIGFGGSSAGSTLSSVMAQKYKACKLYIGNEGMYNVVDLPLSNFPDEKSRADYGLITDDERKKASAYYNLRKNPPSSLLLQGKDDWLCHYSQTQKFADKIKQLGGKSKVIFYEEINHTCLNPNYPSVFKNSVLHIAKHFIYEFNIEGVDLNAIEAQLNKTLKNNFPHEVFPVDKLYGFWKFKRGSITFNKDGTCYTLNKKGRGKKEYIYKVSGSKLLLISDNGEGREFYMRKNNKQIYEKIVKDGRLKSRKFIYRKVKE